jgi:hypothetical protein
MLRLYLYAHMIQWFPWCPWPPRLWNCARTVSCWFQHKLGC